LTRTSIILLGLPNVPWNLSNPSVVKTGLHITVTLVTWRGVLGWDKSYCAKNTDYLEKFSESSGFVVLWSYFQYILHTCGYQLWPSSYRHIFSRWFVDWFYPLPCAATTNSPNQISYDPKPLNGLYSTCLYLSWTLDIYLLF
jgi:hypothetical protein